VAEQKVATATSATERRLFEEFARKEAHAMNLAHIVIY
jgi:hypothetical protein